MNRRHFIRQASALAGISTMGIGRLAALVPSDSSYLTFDFHAHPGAFYSKDTPLFPGDEMLATTLEGMQRGKLSGAFFGIVADMKVIERTTTGIRSNGSYKKGEGWAEYKRQLTLLNAVIKNGNLMPAFKVADLDKAFKDGKTAAFISVEGGDSLEGDPGRLDEMYKDGVRSIQIVHYHTNELGDLQTEEPQYQGLSFEGKEVIRKMNRLKMLIDLAHATFGTTKAVADMTDAPLLLSHSILQMDANRPLARRAISPEHAKVIAGTGGVIGAWPSGFNNSFDEFMDNVKRLIDTAGIDHVGLGTDMDGNFKPVFNSYEQLPTWIDALKKKGLTDTEARKVAGGNARRLIEKTIG